MKLDQLCLYGYNLKRKCILGEEVEEEDEPMENWMLIGNKKNWYADFVNVLLHFGNKNRN